MWHARSLRRRGVRQLWAHEVTVDRRHHFMKLDPKFPGRWAVASCGRGVHISDTISRLDEVDCGSCRRSRYFRKCIDGMSQHGTKGLISDDIDRFWAKVDKAGPDECWNWTAGRCRKGYGWFSLWGRAIRSHRVSYLIARGSIPDGMQVLHTCDVPACVNPAHLWVGTNADNRADMVAKGRASRGAKHCCAKLTEVDIPVIRARLAAGEPQRAIAADYGLHQVAISLIKTGANWAHVPHNQGTK